VRVLSSYLLDTTLAMATAPTFATIGKPTEKINVRLSYRIIELFSEGLYASPHKIFTTRTPPLL